MFKPLTIPLTNGLTQNISDLDARRPGIAYAENVDFTKAGQVTGRLGFINRDLFALRTLDTLTGTTPDPGTVGLGALPFESTAMFTYRDVAGERPGVALNGRVFTWEGDRWADRLYCGSAKVDRIANFTVGKFLDAKGVLQGASYNFFQGAKASLLGGVTPSVESYQAGAGLELYGNGSSTFVGGVRRDCFVGNSSTNNDLWLVVRTSNGHTLTSTKLATDCLAVTFGSGTEVSPPMCTGDTQGSTLWVSYQKTTVTDQVILRVNSSTGAILSSVTIAIGAGFAGHWLQVDQGNNQLANITTRRTVLGASCRLLNATTLVSGVATAFDGAAATFPDGACTVGLSDTAGTFWIAYTKTAGSGSTLVIGKYNGGAPNTAIHKTYFGADFAGTPQTRIGIAHQPIRVSSGVFNTRRTVMGVQYAITPASSNVTSQTTWFCVDLDSLVSAAGAVTPGGTLSPGLLAQGPSRGSGYSVFPMSAVTSTDARSWRFCTFDFQEFNSKGGTLGGVGLNEVSFISPRAAGAGEQTVLSGSVPHVISRGFSTEVGFPQHSPSVRLSLPLPGFLTGSTSIQAVWARTDEAGVVHRSCPSFTETITPAVQSIQVVATNCQLTELEFGSTVLEIYSTIPGATANSPKFLTLTVPQSAGATTTASVGQAGPGFDMPEATSARLYTEGGTVFVNTPVSADGGVATVGRRMWLSDGVSVFASKLLRPDNNAPAWNDEGVLQVNPPAPAGRVLALEPLIDKLVILCERGIYVTQGDGPDDTGVGPDFLFPVQVSSLGISNSHGSVSTPYGVIFHANNTGASGPGTGGIYVLEGATPVPLSLPAMDELGTRDATLSFLPEKDQLYVNLGTKVLVYDLRSKNWSVLVTPLTEAVVNVTSALGVVWAVMQQAGEDSFIGEFSAETGLDNGVAFTQLARLNHVFSNTTDGLGWSKVKSVSVLGDPAEHHLVMTAVPDQTGPDMTKTFDLVVEPPSGHWPTGRYAPEWNLPYQKSSSLQVTLQATPATATWAALRLMVLPSRHRAPAKNRG